MTPVHDQLQLRGQVEGHDWWPARVVRRRAVPREVGPPPGAPAFVRHHIPVVFFTRKGIPGEVDEGMDSANGALSACLRALKASGTLAAAHCWAKLQ